MSTKSSLTPGMTTKLLLTYSALISAKDLSHAYFYIKIDARSSNEYDSPKIMGIKSVSK